MFEMKPLQREVQRKLVRVCSSISATMLRKQQKKVILYSNALDLYRNIQIIVMLGKIFEYYPDNELQMIEFRFFVSGHSTNDCNRLFDTTEKKNHHVVYLHQMVGFN